MAKAHASTTLNPKWLVSFKDKAWADLEAYESSFLVRSLVGHQRSETDSPTSSTEVPSIANSDTDSVVRSVVAVTLPPHDKAIHSYKRGLETEVVTPEGNSHDYLGLDVKKPRKTVTFDKDVISASTTVSESDTSKKIRAAALARRERNDGRRRRRQADTKLRQSFTKPKLRSGANELQPQPAVENEKEDVVRVSMLTGTLLIYRGSKRRAEFIRNV